VKERGFFLCEKTIVDQKSNMLSLINVFDNDMLQPAGFPVGIHDISFVCLLEKDSDDTADEYDAELSVKNDEKILTPSMPVKIFFQGSKTARLIMDFNGIIIQNESGLSFNLKIKNTDLSITKTLKILPQITIK
jgi:hypothetical protein